MLLPFFFYNIKYFNILLIFELKSYWTIEPTANGSIWWFYCPGSGSAFIKFCGSGSASLVVTFKWQQNLPLRPDECWYGVLGKKGKESGDKVEFSQPLKNHEGKKLLTVQIALTEKPMFSAEPPSRPGKCVYSIVSSIKAIHHTTLLPLLNSSLVFFNLLCVPEVVTCFT